MHNLEYPQALTLADQLPGMAYSCLNDDEWTFNQLSLGAQALTGFSAIELLGQHRTLNSLIHADDVQRVCKERAKNLLKLGEYTLEYRIIAACGTEKHVQDQGRACYQDGQIVAFAGLMTDATLRIQHQLRQQKAEKAIMSAALNPYLAAGNVDAFCREVSRLAVEALDIDQVGVWLFNDNRDELHLVSMSQKEPAEYIDLLYAKDYPDYFQALRSGRAIDVIDVYNDARTAEFTQHYMPVTGVTALLDATVRLAGEVVGVLCCEQRNTVRDWSSHDIAFVGQMADQLSLVLGNYHRMAAERKALEADTRNHAKSHFLATMSHEIRTPMNGVLGMTELLRMTPLSDDQESYIGIIEESGSLLLNIIDEILDFSKLEAGKCQLHETPTDIRRLFAGVVELLFASAAPQVEVYLDIDPALPDMLLLDNHRLRQILLNLISNAIKFTHKGSVQVKAGKTSNTRWSFSVTDTGIGIDEALMSRLFQPFERGERSQNIMGTGLGLAICQRLVILMGGQIHVESRRDVQTRFTVELPLHTVQRSSLPETDKNSAALYRDFAKLRVLIVEDNLVNQKVIDGLLRQLGISADKCSNGVEAVEIFRQDKNKYDLILMDCEMPVMDGFMATVHIRQIADNETLFIAALTAHALPEHRERSRLCGMNYYLTKPIKLDELKRLLLDISQQVSA